MVIGSTVILLRPEVTILLLAMTYLFSGPFEIYWRRRTGTDLELKATTGATGAEPAPGDGHE